MLAQKLSPICLPEGHCLLYNQMYKYLFGHLSVIPRLELTNLSSKALCDLLLFGNEIVNNIDKKLTLEIQYHSFCLLGGWNEAWFSRSHRGWGLPVVCH